MSSQLSTSFQLVFYFDLDFRIIDMEPIGRYCSFDKELFDICRARYVVIRISTQLNVQSKRLWQLNVCHDILTSLFFLTKVLICEWRQTMTVLPMQCIIKESQLFPSDLVMMEADTKQSEDWRWCLSIPQNIWIYVCREGLNRDFF